MENVVTFVIVFSLILFLSIFSFQTFLHVLYSFGLQEKDLFERLLVMRAYNYDKLYIMPDTNGFVLVNQTGREFYHVRVFCWDDTNIDVNAVLMGKYNNDTYLSIRVLSFLNGYNSVEYNLLENGFSTTENVRCILFTKSFIRVFLPNS